eukprot:104073-Rhodomonas_salina.1
MASIVVGDGTVHAVCSGFLSSSTQAPPVFPKDHGMLVGVSRLPSCRVHVLCRWWNDVIRMHGCGIISDESKPVPVHNEGSLSPRARKTRRRRHVGDEDREGGGSGREEDDTRSSNDEESEDCDDGDCSDSSGWEEPDYSDDHDDSAPSDDSAPPHQDAEASRPSP